MAANQTGITDQASILDRVYLTLLKLRTNTSKPAGKIAIHAALACAETTVAQVYEALKGLRRQGRVISVGYGLYSPADAQSSGRAFSLTDMPDGGTKLEIGECLVEFTAGEWARFAPYAAGHAQTARRKARP